MYKDDFVITILTKYFLHWVSREITRIIWEEIIKAKRVKNHFFESLVYWSVSVKRTQVVKNFVRSQNFISYCSLVVSTKVKIVILSF